ncbi:MAG: vitamin K epoxide reductase family protein [Actinomycetota bacterium]
MIRARFLGLGLALASLAVSAYLTVVHYADPGLLLCASGGRVDCEAVTTSRWSEVFGLPVALLGLVWSVGMTALFLPGMERSPRAVLARRVGAIAGMASVLWLVYVEFFLVGAVCLWCTVVHGCVFGLFVLTTTRADQPT